MKKIKRKTWITLILIIVLVIVVWNQFKYDPMDEYSLGTLNPGYDPSLQGNPAA
jgi:hypothetical protein